MIHATIATTSPEQKKRSPESENATHLLTKLQKTTNITEAEFTTFLDLTILVDMNSALKKHFNESQQAIEELDSEAVALMKELLFVGLFTGLSSGATL